jgi:transitional endoplasmic reticulum ATPase
MRFVIRPGSDPTARADATLLLALGLPGGGAIRVGDTHCLVAPGNVGTANSLEMGPRTLGNAGLAVGDTFDVTRAILPQARRVVVADGADLDARHLTRALQGHVVSNGDVVDIPASYGAADGGTTAAVRILEVTPAGAGFVGDRTVIHERGARSKPIEPQPEGRPSGETVTTADALLAGLDTELETMTGWLKLLTSEGDLPGSWGLPAAAGVLLQGPAGCGKSELVAAAAQRSGVRVHEVSLDIVFKPERLLTVLEKAVKNSPTPVVLFVDRIDAVAGTDGMFQNQVAAIMRWFLEAVADRDRMATVLGVSSGADLGSLTQNPLLPRTLVIPPPDVRRRRLLFEAALAQVPAHDIDYAHLAARTAGFSGADVLSAVLQASALTAANGGALTQEILTRAVVETTPSLGTMSLGEVPSYGFDRVAGLSDVKQRLTESVIWQMKDPDRFTRLGIEPPRGLLLYGPPGTGKTFVVRALANESGAAFFTVKGAELLDKWVGESERAVREVFARARAVAPAILFFDEIDALAPERGNSTNSVTDSVVAALLTEMDGISDRGDVFVIGATNRRDLVDSALLRPGRLEVHLRLGLPGTEARRAFFEITDVPFAADVDLDQLAGGTDGMSFADMSGLLRAAALHALRRESSAIAVTRDDLDVALAEYTTTAAGADTTV